MNAYALIVCEPQDGGDVESFICENELELECFQEDNDWLILSIVYMKGIK